MADVIPIRQLHDSHRSHLHASGLTDETLALAGVYTEQRARVIAELLGRRSFARHHGWAIVFPCILPGTDVPYGYRVRPNYPRVSKRGRPIKYEQPDAATAGVLVYFPPRARRDDGAWYRDTDRPLYWTEGEKKSLALDQLELATVGLTGVWNWLDVKHRDETGAWLLHPHIRQHVTVAGRRHVIVYDADARTNEQVMHAAQRLAGVLLAAGATEVRFITPPAAAPHKGIDDYYAAFGEAPTRALLDTAAPIEPIDSSSPLTLAKNVRALEGAPLPDGYRLPEGYEIKRDGSLWRLAGDAKHGDVKITARPVLVVRRFADYYTREERAEICYERNDAWVTLVASRRALVDARALVAELGPYGVPVTSNTAGKIVDWLDDLERVNPGLDRMHSIARTGWHTIDGARAYVLDRPLFAEDADRPIVLDTRGDRRKTFAALTPRGDSLAAHIAALKRAWEAEPICAAMICGALAATLLEPLGVPNFAIHLPGDSSRGKTSMLKVAASVFGDPSNETWVGSWNTTVTAAELRAQTLCDLPQCYDEAGTADPLTLERMIYSLINGGGRARGRADLTLRETPTWRTVVLSTGERPLADDQSATGAQVRVIQFPVNGFGKFTAADVDEVRDACVASAGWFGRAWVELLLGIEDWSVIRAEYRRVLAILRQSATNNLHGRVAGYFATLVTAEVMAHELGLGLAGGKTMHGLYLRTSAREAVSSLAERGLDLVQGWLRSEPDAFPALEPGTTGELETHDSRMTKVRHGFQRDGWLYLIPDELRAFLAIRRLSCREVATQWRALGWLDAGTEHLTKPVRFNGTVSRFYCLNLNVVTVTDATLFPSGQATTGYGNT